MAGASQCLGGGKLCSSLGFPPCADPGVSTWPEQPAALPPSWPVVPSGQQFVPGVLQSARVDRLPPLPASS